MSGGDAFDAELAALAPLGRMVVFGNASRESRKIDSGVLLHGSKAVIGFWLVHVLARRDLAVPLIGELLGALATWRTAGDDRWRLPSVGSGARPRGARIAPAAAASSSSTPLKLMTTFKDLGLSPAIQQALDELGYEEPDADPGGGDPASCSTVTT